jgi:hypothetical protein
MLAQQAAALDKLDKMQQQQEAAAGEGSSSEAAAAAAAAAAAGDSSSKRSSEAAAAAEASSQQQQQQEGVSVQASLEAAGVPSEVAAAADAALKLDDDTLASVSRAIMGRLDIVDLVGRNTAYEVAERVSVQASGPRRNSVDDNILQPCALWFYDDAVDPRQFVLIMVGVGLKGSRCDEQGHCVLYGCTGVERAVELRSGWLQ